MIWIRAAVLGAFTAVIAWGDLAARNSPHISTRLAEIIAAASWALTASIPTPIPSPSGEGAAKRRVRGVRLAMTPVAA
jgi:hypothetical protein